MIACVGIGTFTGFIFLMVLLLVAGPVDDVIESAAGPLLHIFFNATDSRPGSIILLMYQFIERRPLSIAFAEQKEQISPCVSTLRNNLHHDHKQSHDLRLCPRRWPPHFEILCKSSPFAQPTAECALPDNNLRHHLWMHFPRI